MVAMTTGVFTIIGCGVIGIGLGLAVDYLVSAGIIILSESIGKLFGSLDALLLTILIGSLIVGCFLRVFRKK